MAVQRRVNWISQQRVDVPDMRSVESAASNDFDQLIQAFVTNTSQGYILRGFEISMTGAIGGAASGLQMLVDPGAVMHIAASQSGTILQVPPGTAPQQLNGATNSNVSGSFVPNALNYVGVDYIRYIDPTTDAQVYIWDPTTNSETTKTAPRAQILQYQLNVSTTTWPANILPIAIVQTDAGNNVVSITDCRWLLFRLGTGGANPNPFYTYPWDAQTEGRTETPPSSSSNSQNPFHGGDKMLFSLKDWMNAVMSSFLELKGTTYWYSLGSAGSTAKLREDLGNTLTVGQGTISHSATTPGLINWSDPIFLKVIGSALSYQITANPSSSNIQLADDQVAYINLTRDAAITPNLFYTYNSIPNTTTVVSIGSVSWTSPLAANDFLRAASDTDNLYTKIKTVDSLTQVTLFGNYVPAGQTAAGVKSVYALGTYNAVASPSGPRDIFIANRSQVPASQDVFWLMVREDVGGSNPTVYVRFIGVELEQGDTDIIDSDVTKQLLQYIGSPSRATSKPNYTAALTPGALSEITQITCSAAASITSGQYFYISSSADTRKYYFWFKKDGIGTDPAPAADRIGVQVNITTGQTAANVATQLAAAFAGLSFSDFTTSILSNVLTVTNTSAGTCSASTNINVGGFTIIVTQNGTGVGNHFINDGDNLTLAIKKLDDELGLIASNANNPNYDETLLVVSGAPANTNQVTGPISPGTNLTLPNNERSGNIAQLYTTGKGSLNVYLNGILLNVSYGLVTGQDWTEVGATNTNSAQIQIGISLVVGDKLTFEIVSGSGGGGGGGGGVGPQGPPGPAGPAGNTVITGPVNVQTKTANYAVDQTNDNFLLGNATGGAITFTLPNPTALGAAGRVYFIKKIDSSANAVSLVVSGGANIDNLASQSTIIQYFSWTLLCDGTQYWLF